MELIPILSTIILVATISTFILAVGAYILYKIRERKTQQIPGPVYKEFESEYVEPKIKSYENKVYVEDVIRKQKADSEAGKKFVKTEPRISKETLIANETIKPFTTVKKHGTNGSNEVIIPDTKFTKYTFDEYVDLVEDENVGEVKWR